MNSEKCKYPEDFWSPSLPLLWSPSSVCSPFQDTIVALHALSRYAAMVYGGDIHTDVSVTGAGIQETFTVTNDNSLLQFRVPLEVPNTLAVSATGQGCVFIQVGLLGQG